MLVLELTSSFDNLLTRTVVWLDWLFLTVKFNAAIHSDYVYSQEFIKRAQLRNLT